MCVPRSSVQQGIPIMSYDDPKPVTATSDAKVVKAGGTPVYKRSLDLF
jgi:acetolactate synthase I/II/III large subunit